jgi:hypothetical protein
MVDDGLSRVHLGQPTETECKGLMGGPNGTPLMSLRGYSRPNGCKSPICRRSDNVYSSARSPRESGQVWHEVLARRSLLNQLYEGFPNLMNLRSCSRD